MRPTFHPKAMAQKRITSDCSVIGIPSAVSMAKGHRKHISRTERMSFNRKSTVSFL
jgi:hypothetical protein